MNYIDINNDDLRKLWIFLYERYMFISDTVNKAAFQACDAALTELEEDRNHWKTLYDNSCQEMNNAKEGNRLLDTANRQLVGENEDLKKEIKSLQGLKDDFLEKVIGKDDDIEKLDHMLQDLQREYDKLKNDYEKLKISSDTWRDKARNAEKEIDELKKDCEYMTRSRDAWRSRAEDAEAKSAELKKKCDRLQHAYNGASMDRDYKTKRCKELQEALDNMRAELEAKVTRIDEITKGRDNYRDLYTELKNNTQYLEKFVDGVTDRVKADYDKKLQAQTECLREEVKWYRKHYKEQYDKTQELKSRLNSICGDEYVKKIQNEVHDLVYKQGQTDLWNMLQRVSNYYYFGTDDQFNTDECDATSMEDIIDIHDLDSFIECYENWDRR